VPSGSTVDQTEAVSAVFERFAPRFRDVVVAPRPVPAARLADHNANYVGGGYRHGRQHRLARDRRPNAAAQPWATPIPVYLCSAANPPGSGVHGMAGYYAARTVLRREFGIPKLPSLAP
jgi:phytoene dehydrogenase-like protein